LLSILDILSRGSEPSPESHASYEASVPHVFVGNVVLLNDFLVTPAAVLVALQTNAACLQ